MKSCNEMNMSIEFKKFYNKILLDMKTFEVTIDHILVYFIGSKLGLYVSFLIRLYMSLQWIRRLDIKFGDSKTLEEIIGIYETNKFNGGVGIQASRFNHSCCSNAEGVWNKEDGSREFRIVKKIKSGETLVIS